MHATDANWRRRGDRKGLAIIVAALLAITAVMWLMLQHQADLSRQQLRQGGFGLVRMLAEVAPGELLPGLTTGGPLDRLAEVADSRLAYVAVTDPDGRTLFERDTGGGVRVPPAELALVPADWVGERAVTDAMGRALIEFRAPLLEQAELAGFVRLGYYDRAAVSPLSQLPFLASLALPVFLLVPLFHWLMRREIAPLHQATEDLGRAMEEGQTGEITVHASGELGELLRRMNGFVAGARQRVEYLEHEQETLETSAKLMKFRKTRMEQVLQALPDAVLVLDEAGSVSFASDRVEDLLGVGSDVVRASDPAAWCDDPLLLDFLLRCADGMRPGGVSVEFTPQAAADKVLCALALPLFGEGAALAAGGLVVISDITQQVLARQSRADFVAHVSHELKTPLNVLSMYSDALRGEAAEEPEFRLEAANVVYDEVDRLATLIDNLLNITRIETGSLQLALHRTRLGELLQDAFDTVARADSEHGLSFALDLPEEGLPALMLDKDLLRVAINNLLTNAIKYNRPGGRVTVSAELLDSAVRIAVTDTGIGISEDDLPRVFDKFFRSESGEVRERPGHGLGLSLARDIVALHNGSLSVTSRPGEGTTFTIELWKDTDTLRKAG